VAAAFRSACGTTNFTMLVLTELAHHLPPELTQTKARIAAKLPA